MTTITRQARCASCGTIKPSNAPLLPFFEDRSPGTQNDRCAICRYFAIAHERFSGRLRDTVGAGHWPRGVAPHDFEPMTEGYEFDSFYCGCRGWD